MITLKEYENRLAQIERECDALKINQREIYKKLEALNREKNRLQQEFKLSRIKNQKDNVEWVSQNYEWSENIKTILEQNFKLSNFRMTQLPAINATLSKKDVLVVMPTGGGKSLIYQLPILVTKNLTLVVCPLISLMENQLLSFKGKGITGAIFNSTLSSEEKKNVITSMTANQYNVIFIAPEMIARSKNFMNNLRKVYQVNRLDRIVIDEVHCCSHWGHDFRKDYQSLNLFKEEFPNTPILGLTATASLNILIDIQTVLSLPDPVILRSSYNRPNLFYKVTQFERGENKITDLLKLLEHQGSGIVYCHTQKQCEDLVESLREKALKVRAYHASLPSELKSKVHHKWMDGSYPFLVATVAFGMGIDKPDVRSVIHYNVSRSVEEYYQESGRAGRDNSPAHCELMFSFSDWLSNFAHTQSSTEEQRSLSMLDYCLNITDCRRKLISKYFDDEYDQDECLGMCDNCINRNEKIITHNILSCLHAILEILDKAEVQHANITFKKLLDAWYKRGPAALQFSGVRPEFTVSSAGWIIAVLVSKKFLTVEKGYSSMAAFSYFSANTENASTEPILMESRRAAIKGIPLFSKELEIETIENKYDLAQTVHKRKATQTIKKTAQDMTLDTKKPKKK